MPKLQKDLYLKHDIKTLQDLRIIKLNKKYSHTGYSIYWRLLEYMQSTDDCSIRFEDLDDISDTLLYSDCKDVKTVLDYCLEIGLFIKTEDGGAFYSKRLRENRAEIEAKSEKARKSIKKRWEYERNTDELQSCNEGNTNKKENNNKTENKNYTDNKSNDSCTEQTCLLHASSESAVDGNSLLSVEKSTSSTDFSIPLNDGSPYYVEEADYNQWQKLFPAVDVAQQLRQMRAWADANPKRRKTIKGVKKFIVNWLSKEQDKGATAFMPAQTQRKKEWEGTTKSVVPVKAPSLKDMYDGRLQ